MKTVEEARIRFTKIVDSLTGVIVETPDLDADLLTRATTGESRNLAELERKVRAMRTPLPNGAMVSTHDYEVLSRFGQSNGIGLEVLQDGVNVEEGSGRVTFLASQMNRITDASALSGLTSLRELHLHGNQIKDIAPFSGLTSLEVLDLNSNRIIDITSLSGLTSLKTLTLYGNQVQDISALAGLSNLDRLDIGSNSIGDISAITGLSSLRQLDVSSNALQDISQISRLTSLQVLFLSANGIQDISVLSGLTSLKHVSISMLRNPEIEFDKEIAALMKRGVLVDLRKYEASIRLADRSPQISER